MSGDWHEGERALQRRAGLKEGDSAQLRAGIRDAIPERAAAFLAAQSFAVLATVDGEGRPWASLAVDAPGFLETPHPKALRIRPEARVDPLALANLAANPRAGLLAIEFATRKRARLNGDAAILPDGSLRILAREVYSNCPKYIQARAWTPRAEAPAPGEPVRSAALSESQRAWIAGADTFFIATAHAEGGADASHRGGAPGFVRVEEDGSLWWPDYFGNFMFQTLGNLEVDPRAGLLFVDFETGATLQLTGEARVLWDDPRIAATPGAERIVAFRAEEIVETPNAFPFPWAFEGWSPHNPK